MNAFGRYEIIRRIGVGGMGEVFLAWAYGAARTRKPVVVKVLRDEMLSEPGAAEMFVEEGRLSLSMSHSNVLQVFDFGKSEGGYFMAMEWVDGVNLRELLKRSEGRRLPPEHAAFIALEVCLGLDYAHRLKDENGRPLKIVHRDVTPANILISREGEVKLADFGIARSVERTSHTQAGQVRGKVRYMSPEAARAEPLDHRTDLFSLGAILFEMLTGRRSFDAKGREAILLQIVSNRAPVPTEVDPTLPLGLDRVVRVATAPDRDDRFADAFAMHRALDQVCHEAGYRPSRGAFLGFLREHLDPPSATFQAAESARPSATDVSVQETPSEAPPVLFTLVASAPEPAKGAIPGPVAHFELTRFGSGPGEGLPSTPALEDDDGGPMGRPDREPRRPERTAPPAIVPARAKPEPTLPMAPMPGIEPPPPGGSWRVRREETPDPTPRPGPPPSGRSRAAPWSPVRLRIPLAIGGIAALLVAGFAATRWLPAASTQTPPPSPARGATSAILAAGTPAILPVEPSATPPPPPTAAPAPSIRVAARPSPKPSATAAAVRVTPPPTGLVDVNSDPWSEVRVGGQLLGNTPLRGLRLPVGRQLLSLRNPRSGKVKTVEIDIQSGTNKPVLVNLDD